MLCDFPFGQNVHFLAEPTAPEYVPDLQGAQIESLECKPNDPAAQLVQAKIPVDAWFEYFPGGQS